MFAGPCSTSTAADHLVELDLGYRPSPSGSGELLLHPDNRDAVLILLVVDRGHQRAGPAIVTFERCAQSLFGYPNDEAQEGDPRLRGHGYGFLEVCDSPWPERLDTYNRQAFPHSTHAWPLPHFAVSCHENLAEFLAEDIHIEIIEGTFAQTAHIAHRQLMT